MSTKRKRKPFTEEELKIIQDSNGKISQKELSEKLGINYSVLSSALNQYGIHFVSKSKERAPIFRTSSALTRKKNEKGELLLTDDHLKEWFKPQ